MPSPLLWLLAAAAATTVVVTVASSKPAPRHKRRSPIPKVGRVIGGPTNFLPFPKDPDRWTAISGALDIPGMGKTSRDPRQSPPGFEDHVLATLLRVPAGEGRRVYADVYVTDGERSNGVSAAYLTAQNDTKFPDRTAQAEVTEHAERLVRDFEAAPGRLVGGATQSEALEHEFRNPPTTFVYEGDDCSHANVFETCRRGNVAYPPSDAFPSGRTYGLALRANGDRVELVARIVRLPYHQSLTWECHFASADLADLDA